VFHIIDFLLILTVKLKSVAIPKGSYDFLTIVGLNFSRFSHGLTLFF